MCHQNNNITCAEETATYHHHEPLNRRISCRSDTAATASSSSSSSSSASSTLSTPSSTTNTTTCNTSRKRIQFCEEIELIPSIIDLRLRKEKWYSKSDYRKFQNEKKETLRHFKQSQTLFQGIDETKYCLRGYEACLTARAIQQKLLRRVAAIQVVMELQLQQQKQRHHSHINKSNSSNSMINHCNKIIKTEYYHVTTPSRTQALDRAALDAREVLKEGTTAITEQQQQQQQQCSSSSSANLPEDMIAMKNEFERLMAINSVPAHPTLRSVTSGRLHLRKTVPNTA